MDHICNVAAIFEQWHTKYMYSYIGVETSYTCMHAYTHTCKDMYTCLLTYVLIYIHTTCMYVCIHTCTCMYEYINIYMQTKGCVSTYTYIQTCIHSSVYGHIHIQRLMHMTDTDIQTDTIACLLAYIHTCMYTHTHIHAYINTHIHACLSTCIHMYLHINMYA